MPYHPRHTYAAAVAYNRRRASLRCDGRMNRLLFLATLLLVSFACIVQRGPGSRRDPGNGSSSRDTGDASDGYQSADMKGDARCYEKELRNDGVEGPPRLNSYLNPFHVQGTTGLGDPLPMRIVHDWTDPWTPYALDSQDDCWDAHTVHMFMGIEDDNSSDYAWFTADVYALPTNAGVVGIANAVRIEQADWPWALGDVEAGSTGTMTMNMTTETVTIQVRGTDGVQWLNIEAPRP